MKRFALFILVAVCAAVLFPLSTAAAEVHPTAVVPFDFTGFGHALTPTAAVEAAVKDAENEGASQGYGGCQLKQYSYWSDGSSGWNASAVVTCYKDTTPPPPPPPPNYPPPTISGPVRDGNNHTVSWSSTVFARFALYQSINQGGWKEVYKGESRRSWTMYNAAPGTYSYSVTGIANDGGASSPVVSITVSLPPSSPLPPTSPSIVGRTHTVSWSSSTNSDQYILERGDEAGMWSSVYIGPNTSWTAVGVSPGTYHYRVKACTNGACSGPSTESVFIVVVDDSPVTNYLLSN